jgi:aminoglycoside phosphotransferase (APT) family kinase protein
MEILGRGRQATVFASADGLAIKVFEPSVDESSARREAEVADAVYQLGAPAPRIDRVRQHAGRWAIEFERLPGPALIEELLTDPAEAGADLGRLAAAIHALDGVGFEEVRDQWLRRVRLPECADIEESIRGAAADLPDGRSLLHTDLHPFNVMRNRCGDWVAIDWEGAAHGAPAADLCRTMFLLVEADGPDASSDPSLARLRALSGSAFLAAYRRAAGPISDEQISAWRSVMLAARLGEDIAHERSRLLDELRRSAEWSEDARSRLRS